MELRHILAFIAVAERESFIQAATQLHLSQPAVTAQIQRLEQDLGVRLFDRNRRRVLLTPAGRAFLPGAQATLRAAEQATEAARRAAAEETGRLRLGFVPSVSRFILPNVLTELHRQHPQARLELFSQHTSVTVSLLLKEQLDVGYVRLPVYARGLRVIPMHREPFMVCMLKTHPLAQQESINFADLRQERFIFYDRKWAPGYYDAILSSCQRAGYVPTVSQEIDEMYVVPSLIAAGEGISILPQMAVMNLPETVTARPLWAEDACSEIGIVVRNEQHSALVEAIVAISEKVGSQYSNLTESPLTIMASPHNTTPDLSAMID